MSRQLSQLSGILDSAIRAAATDRPEAEAYVSPTEAATWSALAAQVDQLASRLTSWSGRQVGVRFPATRDGLALLAALDRLQADVYLLDITTSDVECDARAVEFGWDGWLSPSDGSLMQRIAADQASSENRADLWPDRQLRTGTASSTHPMLGSDADEPHNTTSSVFILTSGTTGEPKLVRHSWPSLFAPARRRPGAAPGRWLLSYRPQLYAGLQVIVQCIVEQGTLVVAGELQDPDQLAEFLAQSQVTHASGTPAFWRRLLTFASDSSLRRIPLQQITLGGEPVDQRLLDQLVQVFPSARVVQIYATTELGRCFSVTDGRAGFPARWLAGPQDQVELKVEDDELWVRPVHGASGYSGSKDEPGAAIPAGSSWPREWTATGDLVMQVGDRIFFAGRRSDMINVGGNKVSPLKVENLIRAVDGILEARVYGVPSSLTGQIVACDVVVSTGYEEQLIRDQIGQVCRQGLARHELPRAVNIVPKIETNLSGKLRRSST